jgi:hypothetical protein
MAGGFGRSNGDAGLGCVSLRFEKREPPCTFAEAGRDAWAAHLIEYKLFTSWQTPEEAVRHAIESTERNAKYSVRADAAIIPDFCVEVLKAFGSDGRIFPDLIADPRKKA